MEVAQLTQIRMFHQLHDILSLKAAKHDVAGQFFDQECECCGQWSIFGVI